MKKRVSIFDEQSRYVIENKESGFTNKAEQSRFWRIVDNPNFGVAEDGGVGRPLAICGIAELSTWKDKTALPSCVRAGSERRYSWEPAVSGSRAGHAGACP